MTADIIRVSNDVEMNRRRNENEYLGESHHDHGDSYAGTPSPKPSPPTSLRQTVPPLVIPSQTYPLPRIPFTHTPAHSHSDSLPQFLSTPVMPGRPPLPIGPRSPTSRTPVPDRGGILHPACGNLLEQTGYLHTDSEEDFPIRPSVKALSQRRVVMEVGDVSTRPATEGEQDAILAASNYDMVIDIDMAIDPSWAGKDPKLDSVVQSACSSRVNLEKKVVGGCASWCARGHRTQTFVLSWIPIKVCSASWCTPL